MSSNLFYHKRVKKLMAGVYRIENGGLRKLEGAELMHYYQTGETLSAYPLSDKKLCDKQLGDNFALAVRAAEAIRRCRTILQELATKPHYLDVISHAEEQRIRSEPNLQSMLLDIETEKDLVSRQLLLLRSCTEEEPVEF
jgi:hypothetical protein